MTDPRVTGIDATLGLGDDGILRLRWARGIAITEEAAQTAMDKVNELCAGIRRPMLVDMATTASVSRGARAVFGKPCSASKIALLGASPVDRVIANFVLGISHLPCPTRFFTSEPEATQWLSGD
ncbi:DUF7793 family protein [Arthrobacter sp. H14]|uniref:DUF7793 family protein n=1 Tax=Arthrobacter sp. H14 TaxID=1312959 RepID=UPI0004B37E8B|nr:STAS/SEC14 domain-containing protein [Arthrobacter sp. H14]